MITMPNAVSTWRVAPSAAASVTVMPWWSAMLEGEQARVGCQPGERHRQPDGRRGGGEGASGSASA
ncbi:hypothetical protein ABT294_16795 [Nonomuraea sp. NPDC000554]|uniref:hypothetical protein n=1 Tax=Nonomuraea sp. NPDC000554 TaxID=3154259 RepID=UPI00332F8042